MIEDEAVALGMVGDAMREQIKVASVFGNDSDIVCGDFGPAAGIETAQRLFEAVFDAIVRKLDGKKRCDIAEAGFDRTYLAVGGDKHGACHVDIVDDRIEQDVFVERHLQTSRFGNDDIGRKFVSAPFDGAVAFEKPECLNDRLSERIGERLRLDVRCRR